MGALGEAVLSMAISSHLLAERCMVIRDLITVAPLSAQGVCRPSSCRGDSLASVCWRLWGRVFVGDWFHDE